MHNVQPGAMLCSATAPSWGFHAAGLCSQHAHASNTHAGESSNRTAAWMAASTTDRQQQARVLISQGCWLGPTGRPEEARTTPLVHYSLLRPHCFVHRWYAILGTHRWHEDGWAADKPCGTPAGTHARGAEVSNLSNKAARTWEAVLHASTVGFICKRRRCCFSAYYALLARTHSP